MSGSPGWVVDGVNAEPKRATEVTRTKPVDASVRYPVIFLPHGGGPCFFMDWTMGPADTWDQLAAWLHALSVDIGTKPAAIVVISGHWEEPVVTVGAHPSPSLIYDYYGFPEFTYQLQYPAPGSPAVALRVRTLLNSAGIACELDLDRGLDHGVFVPLKLVYPDADVPIVPVSLRADLNAAFHFELGRALAPLRDEGVLIVGSGMSFHNMATFGRTQAAQVSLLFDEWLTAAIAQAPDQRRRQLSEWGRAPAAQLAHPRCEHLLPLMVIAGAAEADPGERVFNGEVMGATISGYGFGMLSP